MPPLFLTKGLQMPGIRFTFLRDEGQESWVEDVVELQPETHSTYVWNSEHLKSISREGVHVLLDRFLDSTGLIKDD